MTILVVGTLGSGADVICKALSHLGIKTFVRKSSSRRFFQPWGYDGRRITERANAIGAQCIYDSNNINALAVVNPSQCLVLHQIRNPICSVRAMVHGDLFKNATEQDMSVVQAYATGGDEIVHKQRAQIAMAYWTGFNRFTNTLSYARKLSGLSYRLENVLSDSFICHLVGTLGLFLKRRFKYDDVVEAITGAHDSSCKIDGSVTDSDRHDGTKSLCLDELPDCSAKDDMVRYALSIGYTMKDIQFVR